MQRTPKQNNSLHKFCEQVADQLNDAGYEVNDKVVIQVGIPYSKDIVKEIIFKPVMWAMYPNIKSTADLSTVQIQQVYEVVNRALGERAGIYVPWPSEENR